MKIKLIKNNNQFNNLYYLMTEELDKFDSNGKYLPGKLCKNNTIRFIDNSSTVVEINIVSWINLDGIRTNCDDGKIYYISYKDFMNYCKHIKKEEYSYYEIKSK